MDANLLERYADLIVSVGANVQPDQVLAVEALPEAQPLVAAIARRAYEKGARYVDVQYFDPQVKRIRAEFARDETLDWVPPWPGQRMLALGDLDAARVVLVPLVPPGLLDGVDAARAGRDRLPTIPETFRVIDDRSIAWTLSPYPTLGWAEIVYPDLDGAEALERLWHDVAHICRLDEPDPAAAWQERIEQIWQSASKLDALDLDSLHFDGPGTDLTVGLLPSSRFAKEGGSSQTRTGVRHVPNIPTEEVYTTPDPERTEGVVTATKPLDVAGSLVTGLRIRFEGGRAVEIDADTNVGRAASALRDRRRRVTARRGRARRPREPHRQARTHVLHDAARRERGEPPRARRCLLRADRRRLRSAAHQRERRAHRLHDRLRRRHRHRHDEGRRAGGRSCAAAPGRSERCAASARRRASLVLAFRADRDAALELAGARLRVTRAPCTSASTADGRARAARGTGPRSRRSRAERPCPGTPRAPPRRAPSRSSASRGA